MFYSFCNLIIHVKSLLFSQFHLFFRVVYSYKDMTSHNLTILLNEVDGDESETIILDGSVYTTEMLELETTT